MQKKPNDSKPEEYDLLIEANMANIGIAEEDDFDEDGSFDEEMLGEILEDEENWFNEESVFNEEESIEEMSQEDSYNYNDEDNVQPRGFVDPEDSVDPWVLSVCGSETCLVCRPWQ